MAKKGVFKERLLQVISVATQVAISRRVQRKNIAELKKKAVFCPAIGGSWEKEVSRTGFPASTSLTEISFADNEGTNL